MEKLAAFKRDGKVFVVPHRGVGQGVIEKMHSDPASVTDPTLTITSDYVFETKTGTATKNREGSTKEMSLTDRLLLNASTRFAFRGEDLLGMGFSVSADWDNAYSEFWAILMSKGDAGDPGYVLCEHYDEKGTREWVDETDFGSLPDTLTPVSIEEQHEAVLLALRVAQGEEVYGIYSGEDS